MPRGRLKSFRRPLVYGFLPEDMKEDVALTPYCRAYLFILWKMMGCSGARVSWRGSVSIANIQTLNA